MIPDFYYDTNCPNSYISLMQPPAQVKIEPPITPEWKAISKNWGHPFHPMCSYMAMFPPRIPHYFIQRFTNPGDIVLDPFSGRGTTPTQACVEGRPGIANDLNPLAYILSRAKVDPPEKAVVLERVNELESLYSDYSPEPTAPDADIAAVFDPYTFRQLAFLKSTLGDNRTDVFIKATILGILHGKYRRNGTDSIYLSIDMPNTFSMSPAYIRKYVHEKQLEYLPLDAFRNVRRRLDRLYRSGRPVINGQAHQLDVRDLSKAIAPESIQLVVTSPPYLKVVKYGLYNWIRLWFLDVPRETVDQSLDDGHKLPAYLDFMKETMLCLEALLKPGGIAALVIGDVAQNGAAPLNLAEAVWSVTASDINLRLVDIVPDNIADSAKVTKIWNDTRGRATAVDRILVLCKGSKPTVNHSIVNWRE